jgi:hypothetical protein
MASQRIAHVVVNSLEPDAKARLGLIPGSVLWPALALGKRMWGGLWVGGDLYLDSDALRFVPNAMNAKLHYGDLRWTVPLKTIAKVAVRKATVTDIIDIVHGAGTKSVRCYNADEFARQIDSARA